MNPEYKERLEKFLDRVVSVATYTRATLPHLTKGGSDVSKSVKADHPEYAAVHKGRAMSSRTQLENIMAEAQMLKSGLQEDPKPCKCGQPGRTERSCPYESEINDNPASYCNCCERCTQNCLDAI